MKTLKEKYVFCVSLKKNPENYRLFKSERDALDTYRILTLYGYMVTVEKKEVEN
ncbi:hypothetical protein [Photorhabdus africana]|uniref:hypothetical protein n=1 Tax=Photorhabdus africana TaxID=3097554 RepID=UPI002B4184ED|nr:hypothetical protein [Photorhabdus sp. CRI-LC]